MYILTPHSTSYYKWIIAGCAIGFALITVTIVAILCYLRMKRTKQEAMGYINPSSEGGSSNLLRPYEESSDL